MISLELVLRFGSASIGITCYSDFYSMLGGLWLAGLQADEEGAPEK
jgi:hypothetical protein